MSEVKLPNSFDKVKTKTTRSSLGNYESLLDINASLMEFVEAKK